MSRGERSSGDPARLFTRVALRSMSPAFVIYGQSRSGSTLLVRLLDAHPDVHCDGELLSPGGVYIRSQLGLKAIRKYPIPYFNHRRRRATGTCYGFKLLVYQATFAPRVFTRLEQEGWKFLHVRRKDVFRQALSDLVAHKMSYFHRHPGSQAPDHQVSITTQELDKQLRNRGRKLAKEREMIDGIEHLEVWYEDDLLRQEAWPSTTAKVSEYLGLASSAVGSSDLQTTHDRSYDEIIVNYEELEQHLAQIGFERYSNDPNCTRSH